MYPGISRVNCFLRHWWRAIPGHCNEGRTGVFLWCVISWFYFRWKFFSVTRDLKALRDPWRTWIVNRCSWFYRSILRDIEKAKFSGQGSEWSIESDLGIQFAIWSLDLAIRILLPSNTVSNVTEQVIKKSISCILIFVMRDSESFISVNRGPIPFRFVNRTRDSLALPHYDSLQWAKRMHICTVCRMWFKQASSEFSCASLSKRV